MAPFRFAVQLSRAVDGPAWRAVATKIEDLGYSTLFVPDHFDDQFGPLVALTVAAEATTTLKVGSLVFGNDYRHPVVLAKEIATLDLLSSGRVEFGLGAGWMASDYAASGIPLEGPGVRIDRLEESLAVLKSLWSGAPTTYEGAHYRIDGLVGTPPPSRRPHPTIVIGGGGRRVLTLAAREADVVGVNASLTAGYIGPEVVGTVTAEHFRRRIDWVREAAGSRFGDIELQCLTFLVQVTDDVAGAAGRLSQLMGFEPSEVLESPVALIGSVDGMAETLRARRDEFGFSYVVVHEGEMEAFAPVVARLAGT